MDDVGVRGEPGEGVGLADEAGPRGLAREEVGGEELDHDRRPLRLVRGQVHGPHGPGPERAHQPAAGDDRADARVGPRGGGGGHRRIRTKWRVGGTTQPSSLEAKCFMWSAISLAA